MAKKKITRFPHAAPSKAITNGLAKESDRGCILVGFGYIEHALDRLVAAYVDRSSKANSTFNANCLDLDHRSLSAFLGSSWAKATFSVLVGIIDQNTFDLYNAIRHLRNYFAHNVHANQITDDIATALWEYLTDNEKAGVEYYFERIRNPPCNKNGIPIARDPYSDFPRSRIIAMEVCKELYVRLMYKYFEVADVPHTHRGILIAEWGWDTDE